MQWRPLIASVFHLGTSSRERHPGVKATFLLLMLLANCIPKSPSPTANGEPPHTTIVVPDSAAPAGTVEPTLKTKWPPPGRHQAPPPAAAAGGQQALATATTTTTLVTASQAKEQGVIPTELRGDWHLDLPPGLNQAEGRHPSLTLTGTSAIYRHPGPSAALDIYETVEIRQVVEHGPVVELIGTVRDGTAVLDGPQAEATRGFPRRLTLRLSEEGHLHANGLYGQDLPLDYVRPKPQPAATKP